MKVKFLIPILLLLLVLAACNAAPDASPSSGVSLNPSQQAAASASPEPSPTPPPTPTPTPNPAAKIQFAGDILLHGVLRDSAKTADGGYDFTPYFEEIKPYIDGDLTVCNMEGPVDAYGDNQKLSTYPRFNAPLEILDALKYAGFNTLITANNHTYDKEWSGLVNTRNNILSKGFWAEGSCETQEQFDTPFLMDVGGMKVSIIAYSEIDNGLGGVIPSDKRGFAMRRFTVSDESLASITADIKRERERGADLVVVSFHWGNEYQDDPPKAYKNFARKLMQNGCDILMGNHSHCVQPVEWVETERGRRLVIYSLGNFFVDQTLLNPPKPKTQFGMLVSVNAEIVSDKLFLTADILPTYMEKKSIATGKTYMLHPNNETAAAHVFKIIGDEIPVFEFEN